MISLKDMGGGGKVKIRCLGGKVETRGRNPLYIGEMKSDALDIAVGRRHSGTTQMTVSSYPLQQQ